MLRQKNKGNVVLEQIAGRIVKVTVAKLNNFGLPCWRYEGPIIKVIDRKKMVQIRGIDDALLLPLTPHDDDQAEPIANSAFRLSLLNAD